MTQSKVGQIVWHDLFTSDRKRSMAFYQRITNWTYQIERATDFAWGGGEKDFVLAFSDDEAGAGLAETPSKQSNGWIAYTEVPDVDVAVERAKTLGGTNVRAPFEVPGVGRNALIRDPLGALLGISLSRHGFPVPCRQFGPEVYFTEEKEFPELFYAELFGWRVCPKREQEDVTIIGPSGTPVATQHRRHRPDGSTATWVPSIRVKSTKDACHLAEDNGARRVSDSETMAGKRRKVVFSDPDGAFFSLIEEL